MNVLYEFPKQASFGRMLPKSKIYDYTSPTTAMKELFVREVEKIIWSYKLSPETTNLPAKDRIQEIQIFTVVLKTGTLKYEVLSAIDKVIPSPILFALTFGSKTRYVAAYKRQSEVDTTKWVVSSYFETDWISDATPKIALPVVLDLGALYRSMLKSLIPLSERQNETLDELVARSERLMVMEREAAKVEACLKKEKQFNHKVEINTEMKRIKQEIEELKR